MSAGTKRLMRIAVATDVDESEPEYIGSFSADFRLPDGAEVVAVDWSKRGEVEITFMLSDRFG